MSTATRTDADILDRDGAALYAAIMADPKDDFHRLAYADWMEEQGQAARAEFIRVQLEIARLEKTPGRPEGLFELSGWRIGQHLEMATLASFADDKAPCRCEMCLMDRQRELWGKGEVRLPGCLFPAYLDDAKHLKEETPYHGGCAVMLRGFVGKIVCPLAAWEKHGAALKAAYPLERVELTDKRPQVNASDGLDGPGTGPAYWEWWLAGVSGRGAEAPSLPAKIYNTLAGRRWPTREKATDALSAALLATA